MGVHGSSGDDPLEGICDIVILDDSPPPAPPVSTPSCWIPQPTTPGLALICPPLGPDSMPRAWHYPIVFYKDYSYCYNKRYAHTHRYMCKRYRKLGCRAALKLDLSFNSVVGIGEHAHNHSVMSLTK